MLQRRHYVFDLSIAVSVYPFIRYRAKHISFASQEYWTDCDEIRDRQSKLAQEQDTIEYLNRRQSVLPRCQTGADA